MPELLLALAFASAAQDLDALMRQLNDDSIDVRARAVDALAALPPDRVPELRKRLDGLGAEARGGLRHAIARIEDAARLSKFLPPYRPVSFAFQNKPAKEAVAEWSARTGVAVDLSDFPSVDPLTLRIDDRPPMEGLDAISREAKILWQARGKTDWLGRSHLPEAERLVFYPVPPEARGPTSVAYVRHYRITAAIVERQLFMEVETAPGVRPYSSSLPELGAAQDDQGRDRRSEIRWPPAQVAGRVQPAQTGVTCVARIEGDDPTPLSRLSGRLRFFYPREILWSSFEKPEDAAGRSLEHAGLKVALQGCRRKLSGHEVKLSFRRSDGRPLVGDLEKDLCFPHLDIELVTRDGRRLRSIGLSAGVKDESWELTLDMEDSDPDPAAELRIPRVERLFEDVVDFDLRNVPSRK